jgi:hypothetical protein
MIYPDGIVKAIVEHPKIPWLSSGCPFNATSENYGFIFPSLL